MINYKIKSAYKNNFLKIIKNLISNRKESRDESLIKIAKLTEIRHYSCIFI